MHSTAQPSSAPRCPTRCLPLQRRGGAECRCGRAAPEEPRAARQSGEQERSDAAGRGKVRAAHAQ
eukprot:282723-Prymnesium_polylepis.1